MVDIAVERLGLDIAIAAKAEVNPVQCQNSVDGTGRPNSSCFPIVEIQKTAKAGTTNDRASGADRFGGHD